MENSEKRDGQNTKKGTGFIDVAIKYVSDHKYEILASAVVGMGVYLSHKISTLENDVERNFNRMVKETDANEKYLLMQVRRLYDNSDILKCDINTIATTVGFKGSLGCNILAKED